ncbi:MAG: hypothetical protein U0V70_18795 [Terriglobia bacterium]
MRSRTVFLMLGLVFLSICALNSSTENYSIGTKKAQPVDGIEQALSSQHEIISGPESTRLEPKGGLLAQTSRTPFQNDGVDRIPPSGVTIADGVDRIPPRTLFRNDGVDRIPPNMLG